MINVVVGLIVRIYEYIRTCMIMVSFWRWVLQMLVFSLLQKIDCEAFSFLCVTSFQIFLVKSTNDAISNLAVPKIPILLSYIFKKGISFFHILQYLKRVHKLS